MTARQHRYYSMRADSAVASRFELPGVRHSLHGAEVCCHSGLLQRVSSCLLHSTHQSCSRWDRAQAVRRRPAHSVSGHPGLADGWSAGRRRQTAVVSQPAARSGSALLPFLQKHSCRCRHYCGASRQEPHHQCNNMHAVKCVCMRTRSLAYDMHMHLKLCRLNAGVGALLKRLCCAVPAAVQKGALSLQTHAKGVCVAVSSTHLRWKCDDFWTVATLCVL